IIPNTLISIIQQIKSKRTVDKLSLLVKSNATVVRNGKEIQVPYDEVVRDDIIKFTLGEQICADCVVLSGECKVNESMLTGESLPILKKENDKLYGGSFVTSGCVYARATCVGASSYVHTLTAQAKKYRKPKSEILNALNSIIKIIGIAIIPISICLYLRTTDIVKTAGAIIGMIPSGMFLLTTIALAVSVIRLSKNKTLVQELYCIEMLARVDTLAMDKTGTITDGTMRVDKVVRLEGAKLARDENEIIGNILSNMNADNPTSLALKNHFKQYKTLETKKYYAFSSETKFTAVDFGESGVYFIGAPEYVADLEKNGAINKMIDDFAHLGHRVLLLCHSASYDENNFNKSQNNPLCIISLVDNVRQDAIETIKYFKENNVALKVISGDNEITVSEIAKRAGIDGAEKCISLQDKTDDEVMACANNYNVFGRVSPKQKELLIKAMKAEQHTVAMVGDGVNDILALREADCSIAIGAGSESAKNVSHLILVDSNFSHMKNVVGEGRRCINNLQGTSTMFLTKTFIAIILSFFCIITANHYPFSPNQLMVLEMFAIGIPGFFFALQPNDKLVKGKFLDSVMLKSFTQALTALLFILPLYLLVGTEGFPLEVVETLIVLIATCNSLIVLLRV
ncbi:MAG: HAD-IC family P-type ATPase, partial [Christensenellales bacterium]